MTVYSKVQVDKWLKEYDSGLALDSNGVCYLRSQKRVEVALSVSPDETKVMLYAALRQYVSGNEALLQKAMAMNLYQEVSSAGCVAFDPQNSAIVYTAVMTGKDQHDERDRFHGNLTAFFENAAQLTEQLAR